MKVVLFGATGMIGQGVLRECLLDPDIEAVLSVGRSSSAVRHAKLHHLVHQDLWNLAPVEPQLTGFDACFFCLGIASAGMSEADYERVTYGIALSAAETLVRLNPRMVFVLVSGAGADSTERGSVMWARVKGKTENAVLRLPFRAAYVFRPAGVQPVHGERSRTALYRIFYALTRPLWPVLRLALSKYVVTTEQFGRAMIYVVRHGAHQRVLESADIRDCALRDAGHS